MTAQARVYGLYNFMVLMRSFQLLPTTVLAAGGASALAGPCPQSCSVSGLSPSNWTSYHSLVPIEHYCDEPVLFDFNVFNSLDSPTTHITLRSCTLEDAESAITNSSAAAASNSDCQGTTEQSVSLQLASWTSSTSTAATSASSTASTLLGALQTQILGTGLSCDDSDPTIMFATAGDVLAGIYIGQSIVKTSILDTLATQLDSFDLGGSLAAQICGAGYDSTYTVGLILDTTGDYSFVQSAVQSWVNASCITGFDSSMVKNVSISQTRPAAVLTAERRQVQISERDHNDCSYVLVVSGDSCASLEEECGITDEEFTEYNPSSDLCSTLAVGEIICCSAGSVPDLSPHENTDGTCYNYTIQSGDLCSTLASTYYITTDDIETWNSQTWGWMGCSDLQLGQVICLSTGDPPMPAVADVSCGPQVAGTQRPSNWSDISRLNPCPLNACVSGFPVS